MVTTKSTPYDKIHPWERAGLGAAPYRLIGYAEKVYQAIPGDPACPVLPGGSCDYCGQGIRHAYRIQSADGREFEVGADCVRRVNEEGTKIRSAVEAAAAKLRRDAAKAKADTLRDRLAAWLEDHRAELEATPSAHGWKAAQGGTLYGDLVFRLERCGAAGLKKMAKDLGVK